MILCSSISLEDQSMSYFLHSDSNQGKIVCKIASELLWISRLARGEFGWPTGGMGTLKIIQNQRLILRK